MVEGPGGAKSEAVFLGRGMRRSMGLGCQAGHAIQKAMHDARAQRRATIARASSPSGPVPDLAPAPRRPPEAVAVA